MKKVLMEHVGRSAAAAAATDSLWVGVDGEGGFKREIVRLLSQANYQLVPKCSSSSDLSLAKQQQSHHRALLCRFSASLCQRARGCLPTWQNTGDE